MTSFFKTSLNHCIATSAILILVLFFFYKHSLQIQ